MGKGGIAVFLGYIRGRRDHSVSFGSKYAAHVFGGFALAILLLSSVGSSSVMAQPAVAAAEQAPDTTVGVNLNITPKRLTFDRNTRSATVYIFNQGTTAATFDISMVDRVMLPSGEIRPVSELTDDPAMKALTGRLHSARDLLLATPRRATLAPGEGQTIRVRASQPPAAANGAAEYRSHLTVTTIPPRGTGITAEQAAATNPEQLSFRIQSVFGIAIPVIIRPEPIDAQGSIANASIDYAGTSPDGTGQPVRTPILSFDMLRTGANSLFGNVEIRGDGSDKEPLGIARGIGIYPEIDLRTIRIPLRRAPHPGEQLEILFIDDDAKPGTVLARASHTTS